MINALAIEMRPAWPMRPWRTRMMIIGSLVLAAAGGSWTDPAAGEEALGTVQLRNGDVVDGVLMRADLNMAAMRRAIGGVRLLPTSAIAEVHLERPDDSGLVFRFSDWINGASEIERDGKVIPVEDWAEPAAAVVALAKTTGDGGAAPLDLAISSVPGEEGGAGALISLELSAPAQVPIAVVYTTSDGTATAGDDYQPRTGVLTFEPGMTANQIEVPVRDDAIAEGTEALTLIMSADTKLVDLKGVSSIEAVIRDND